MQVGKENLTRVETRGLARVRLLHLDDHLGFAPHGADVDDLGSHSHVVVVTETAASAGTGLDPDLVSVRSERLHPSWDDAYPELAILGFLGDTDTHVFASRARSEARRAQRRAPHAPVRPFVRCSL